MDHVHTRFRFAREARGLTQVDVARHFGVDKGTVCRWDTGATKLNLELLRQAAALFECDRVWLAFGDGKPPEVVANKPPRNKTRARRKAS
jgi:transcriptional regulator with XRE-family HTH domain